MSARMFAAGRVSGCLVSLSVAVFPTVLSAGISPTQKLVNQQVTASAVELGRAFSHVAETLRPTVVFIRKETPRRPLPGFGNGTPSSTTSTGTGFVVRADGYIVTNDHVVAGAREVWVQLYDQREFRAEVVGTDPTTDLAVLKIPTAGLPVASFAADRAVHVGEWVLAIGNPLGHQLSFSVTAGIVSAVNRSIPSGRGGPATTLDYIQTDAVANTGNSGGPLIDLDGRIVGVNAAIYSTTGTYQGYTLAIPVELVRPVVERLIDDGRLRRAGLGVRVEDASVEDAQAVGLGSVYGVVVQEVESTVKAPGMEHLLPGDVIVSLEGRRVLNTAGLQRSVWFRRAGDVVRVEVRRENGRRTELDVPLMWLPEVEVSAASDMDVPPPPCADNPLGVCVSEIDKQLRSEIARRLYGDDSVSRVHGLIVRGVYAVGPAQGKFLPEADIITHVNGEEITSLEELERVLRSCDTGQIVAVRTYRHRTGERGYARVRLAG